MSEPTLTRKGFLGLAAVGAMTAGVGLAGCSSETENTEQGTNESSYTPGEIAETIDADIVVCGLGMSGLAAAVQAANNGDQVVGIEATSVTGGNGIGVEGIFGVGSEMQQAAGIDIKPVEILSTEMDEAQMVADAVQWRNLIDNSADNIAWLQEQGVEFSGEVDNYLGACIVDCFHWFKGNAASEGYISQMTTRAEELGVDIRLSTPGKALIMEDGKVVGIYAENENGDTIQINAKAVILACGGYAQNQEYMERRGWNWDNIVYGGTPNHEGDGLRMAFEAGARSFIEQSTCNSTNICGQGDTFAWKADNFTSLFCGGGMFGLGGNQLWVNENAQRFIAENFAKDNFEIQSMPAITHTAMYSVFDRNILESTLEAAGDTETLDRVDAAEEEDLAVADTLAEAAEYFGLDADALQETVDRYNELCDAESDDDFGKPADLMVPINQPPYYIAKLNQYFLMSVGGIECNVNAQAVDEQRNPIEGLYAVGTDGCMLYRNIYTINIGGTCNGNNINSGRTAANHAHSVISAS